MKRFLRHILLLCLTCLTIPVAQAQESSKVEVPEQNAAAAEAPQESGPLPWRDGLGLGVRGEVDVIGLGPTSAIIPAVTILYTQQKLGGGVTVLVQRSPGLRAEGQFHPFTLGWVRPYARLGATAFFGERDMKGARTLLGSVSGRAALGVDVQFTSRLYAFTDVAYEHFLTGGARYRPQSVLFSMGVGLFP